MSHAFYTVGCRGHVLLFHNDGEPAYPGEALRPIGRTHARLPVLFFPIVCSTVYQKYLARAAALCAHPGGEPHQAFGTSKSDTVFTIKLCMAKKSSQYAILSSSCCAGAQKRVYQAVIRIARHQQRTLLSSPAASALPSPALRNNMASEQYSNVFPPESC